MAIDEPGVTMMSDANPYQSPPSPAPFTPLVGPADFRDLGDEGIELHYTGTIEDLVVVNAVVYETRWWRRPLRLGVLIIGSFMLLQALGPRVEVFVQGIVDRNLSWQALAAGLALLLCALEFTLFPWFDQWNLRRVVQASYGQKTIERRLGPIRLTVTSSGVREELSDSRSEIDWQAFESVDCRADHCLLFLSPMQALVIPRRAFDSDAEFDLFCRRAEGQVAHGRA